MPELPEIQVLRDELAPQLIGRTLRKVVAFRPDLRDPFPPELLALRNAQVLSISRRGKYLLVGFPTGSAVIHLGMSGQLRLVPSKTVRGTHDHLDLVFDGSQTLRLRDPRRFGTVLWQPLDGPLHPRLAHLGPEPLTEEFSARYLGARLAKQRRPIKAAIMDTDIVVGVGNIYATEALFAARISPLREAASLTALERRRLVAAIVQALQQGIALGGSSMRDYIHADGSLGGFLSQAKVYGQAGLPCPRCKRPLANAFIAGRNGAWCPHCQR